jgi:hypothetical protein
VAEAANDGLVSMAELVRCVDREIGFRVRVYPRWVERKKMTQALADIELRRMRAVRDRLVRAEAENTVLTGLAERLQMGQQDLAALRARAEAMVDSLYPVPSGPPVAP